MKFYVASSWRNLGQPAVVEMLRSLGHEVYDFRNPPNKSSFQWAAISEAWQSWTFPDYLRSLLHPDARAGYREDWNAMEWADAFVLVMPSGRSAHLEAGYAVGAGKPLFIYFTDTSGFEPELMYKMADGIGDAPDELFDWVETLAIESE